MANSITLFKQTLSETLDEVYKLASLTALLDGSSDLVKQGANANELIIPKMSVQGLADYDKASGYVSGDVTLTNETVQCNFDRGRMFTVDSMDDLETAGVAYGRLAGELIRTKVVPELDAFRFAKYAGTSGISGITSGAALTTGTAVVTALRVAVTALDEAEIPYENRYLFITPTLDGLIADLDTTKSRQVMERFQGKVLVPQTRFYTAIDMLDGTTSGEESGGYAKGGEAKDINFMVIHRDAVIQFSKHVAPKVILPDVNQSTDGYKFGYRHVAIADVYGNKVKGIYLHYATA
ncbi:MAG: hypothetical protein JW811_10030 [Clostridiales bacterium]|nr:hypothetical protein [Clostridiales bacterium]